MQLKGTAYWAKVLTPVDNYGKDGKEFTIDFVPDEESMERYRAEFGNKKLKPAVGNNGKPHASGTDYLKLTRPVKPNLPPVEVVDRAGNPWPKSALIGNGSAVSLIVSVREGTLGNGQKWKTPGLNKIRVDEHVPIGEDFEYEDEGNAPATTSDEEGWTDA